MLIMDPLFHQALGSSTGAVVGIDVEVPYPDILHLDSMGGAETETLNCLAHEVGYYPQLARLDGILETLRLVTSSQR
jgi:hypothetical protein